MHKAFFLTLLLASASGAFAQTPAFDPREWKGAQAGQATKVLNLGSMHLSKLSAAGKKGMMSALLDKLAAFKPDIITVEDVSGEQCEHLKMPETASTTKQPSSWNELASGPTRPMKWE